MFVNPGERPQATSTAQLTTARQTRDQQKKAFLEILSEANELKDDQVLQRIAGDLEEEAFTQSNGENTREYRTRVNTLKMRMKGLRGKLLRSCLFEAKLSAAQIMAMDMNKLSEEFLVQYLKDNKVVVGSQGADSQQQIKPQTRPAQAAPRPGPPTLGSKPPSQQPRQQIQHTIQPAPEPERQQSSAPFEITEAPPIIQNQVEELQPPTQTQQAPAPAQQGPPPQVKQQIPSPRVNAPVQRQQPQQSVSPPPQAKPVEIEPSREDQQSSPFVRVDNDADESEFDPPQEHLEDLSVPNPTTTETDKIFKQIQKNLEGMQRLAEQLDQDEDEEYLDEEEDNVSPPVQGVYQAYLGSGALSSNNVLNQEFIKDDTEDICAAPQGDLLDEEIREQEQDYYVEQQPEQQDQELHHYEDQEQPIDEEDFYAQNDGNEAVHEHPGYESNVPAPVSSEQFNPVLETPKVPAVHVPEPVRTHPEPIRVDNTDNFLQFQQQPIQEPVDNDPRNPVAQEVFNLLVKQRDQFHAQVLDEQHQVNELLRQNIKDIAQSYQQQLQTLVQKNQSLTQQNHNLQIENETLKSEIHTVKSQFSSSLADMQRAIEQERQGWADEREVLLNIQPSSRLHDEVQYLSHEQQQFASQLNEVQKRNREKQEAILQQLRTRSNDIDKFNENLNQFRMLLIKLHPHNQPPSRVNEQGVQQRLPDVLPQSRILSQPQSTRSQRQPEQESHPPVQSYQQPVTTVQSPPQTVVAAPNESRPFQPLFQDGIPVDQNVFGDSGSTQTNKQHLQESQGQHVVHQATFNSTNQQEDNILLTTQSGNSRPPQRKQEEPPQELQHPTEEQQQPQPQEQTQLLPPPQTKQTVPSPQGNQVFGHPKLNRRKPDAQPAQVNQAKRPDPFAAFHPQPQQVEANQIQWDEDNHGSDQFFQQSPIQPNVEQSHTPEHQYHSQPTTTTQLGPQQVAPQQHPHPTHPITHPHLVSPPYPHLAVAPQRGSVKQTHHPIATHNIGLQLPIENPVQLSVNHPVKAPQHPVQPQHPAQPQQQPQHPVQAPQHPIQPNQQPPNQPQQASRPKKSSKRQEVPESLFD